MLIAFAHRYFVQRKLQSTPEMIAKEGRHISDETKDDLDDGQVTSLIFNGNTIQKLKQSLTEETEIDGTFSTEKYILSDCI